MSNYYYCSFNVCAKNAEDLQNFIDSVRNDDTDLSFERLVPCSEELNKTFSVNMSSLDISKIEEEIRAENTKQKMDLTEEEISFRIKLNNELIEKYKSNMDKYGYKDWRDFRIKEWGTDCEIQAKVSRISEIEVCYSFASWNPPIHWLKKVEKMFTHCKFSMTYKEIDYVSNESTHICKDEFCDFCNKYPKDWLEYMS